MTPDPSLPPPDVRPAVPPPLTDEELTALESGEVPGIFTARGYSIVRRLIADLLAARAEVKRLRDRVEFLEKIVKFEGYE